MKSILYFDTEDSISPPEYEADDVVLFIAHALTHRNITGSFHIIGDKPSILQRFDHLLRLVVCVHVKKFAAHRRR